MKSIILENGTIIKVDADKLWWNRNEKEVTLDENGEEVGVINLDKIVGIVNTKNIKEE